MIAAILASRRRRRLPALPTRRPGVWRLLLPALTALGGLALFLAPASLLAQSLLPGVTATPGPGGAQTYSLSIQTLLLLTLLSFLPAIVLMMTGFTRIIIVLGLLRNAMGIGASPPNSVLIGLALFLTFFAMAPVFDQVYEQAYVPLKAEQISFEQAVQKAAEPLHAFMLHHTRESDLTMLADISGSGSWEKPEDVPLRVLIPAFVTSELKTAFQIGFTLFIPFLIIDLVVASVLMALGMMMVPPVTISLPFKLMLFVLADGWHLLIGSLARSFYV
jgi:flagellar biosynthetic protein FliP